VFGNRLTNTLYDLADVPSKEPDVNRSAPAILTRRARKLRLFATTGGIEVCYR
jgi:hypothetical protein